MIDLNSLDRAPQMTVVTPSDSIFRELGKNTYDYQDLISELIDNAIAARRADRILEVSITITVDSENRPLEFVISERRRDKPA